jgi:iron complex outermembrane receptor protein
VNVRISHPFSKALLLSTSAFALATPAHAQEPANTTATVEEVVVTGSRIPSNGNNSPTPLTVVSTQQLLASTPTSVAAALQQLPVFQNSMGQNSGTGGGNGGPNGAANAPNIRSLGLYRTLTLFDGKRLQPSTDTGLVTIDMFPQMLLQRVDVVTGGVSAVYGSDALSGVVNFVTDSKFNGVSIKAQRGVSERGDDRTTDLGVAAGTELFGGRGHVEASLEYNNDPGILDMFSRDLGQLWQIEGSVAGSTSSPGSAANPFKLYSNVHNASLTSGGLIRSGPLAGQNFGADGVLSAFQAGTATGTSGFQIGGDGAYNNDSSLKGALRAKRAFARFDYDLTDDVHVYLEGFGAKNRNAYNDTTLSINNVVLRSQNPFLPAAYQYGTAATTFTLSKQLGPQLGPHTKIFDLNSYWLNGGLRGKVGNFIWDLGAAHGVSTQTWTTERNINLQHLGAALDAVSVGGNTVCRINADAITTNDDAACAPFNPFGPTAASAQSIAYLTDRTVGKAKGSIDDLTGSITGSPFDTWAGPVNVALSGEWRRVGLSATSEIPPEDKANCTGILYNCTQGTTNLHQVTFGVTPLVHQTVKEAALEVEVPLLKDAPLAQDLSVNLAGRYADYDTFGGALTWKIGGAWKINDELTVRATRSRDFRAPNLNNLYGPGTVSRSTVIDQLTGATLVNAPNQAGGNPDLKPEIGNTLTAGVVYRPRWLASASMSVDLYAIKIKDAITVLNGANVTVQRLCNTSGGTSSLCELIVRPNAYSDTSTANNATYFYSRSVNAAEIYTKGVDVEASYAPQLFDRPLLLRVLTTYQPVLRQDTPSIGVVDVAGYAYAPAGGLGSTPKWRVTGFASYALSDQFAVSASARWRSSLEWNTDPTLVYAEPKIASFWTANVNFSFTPKLKTMEPELFFNIQNIFDKNPPIVINSSADAGRFGAYLPSDDLVGRYYTAGVRLKF